LLLIKYNTSITCTIISNVDNVVLNNNAGKANWSGCLLAAAVTAKVRK